MGILDFNIDAIEVVPLVIVIAIAISLMFVKRVAYPNRVAWSFFAVGAVLGFLTDWKTALLCGFFGGVVNYPIPNLFKSMTDAQICAAHEVIRRRGGYLYAFFVGCTLFFLYALLSHFLEIGFIWIPILS
jgi:vacuolar-type H+-ATPase subunit I/STV1